MIRLVFSFIVICDLRQLPWSNDKSIAAWYIIDWGRNLICPQCLWIAILTLPPPASKETSINSADLQERGMEGKTLPAPLGSSIKSIPSAKRFTWKPKFVYMDLMAALATLAYITLYTLPSAVTARAPSHLSTFKRRSGPREPPEYAQRIYPKDFAVLDTVPPPAEFDGSSVGRHFTQIMTKINS